MPEQPEQEQPAKSITVIDSEQFGRSAAKGACEYLFAPVPWVILAFLIFSVCRNYLAWGLDDSDADGWNRSGLRVHIDAKTGIEYLSDGQGGLTPRLPKPTTSTKAEK